LRSRKDNPDTPPKTGAESWCLRMLSSSCLFMSHTPCYSSRVGHHYIR